jgi:predicted metal-dependent HD superfamily phosphohydrolase
VPDDLYRPGRTRVLQSFAKRPVIFQTAAIREALESQARENLARKIAELNN